MNEDVVVQLRDIRKTYNPGGLAVHVLKGISFSIQRGQFVGIVGTSGSGKSTMLNILGMLDVPTSGDYFLEKVNVATLSDSAQATRWHSPPESWVGRCPRRCPSPTTFASSSARARRMRGATRL